MSYLIFRARCQTSTYIMMLCLILYSELAVRQVHKSRCCVLSYIQSSLSDKYINHDAVSYLIFRARCQTSTYIMMLCLILYSELAVRQVHKSRCCVLSYIQSSLSDKYINHDAVSYLIFRARCQTSTYIMMLCLILYSELAVRQVHKSRCCVLSYIQSSLSDKYINHDAVSYLIFRARCQTSTYIMMLCLILYSELAVRQVHTS